MTPTTARIFNAETVTVETHGSNGPYHPLPAVNVKVRRGFDALSPEQWEGLRLEIASYEPAIPAETCVRFGLEYCERFERERPSPFYEVWYTEACSAGFEQAEELARELFGRAVKCSTAGRSGGWLVVEGLPDVSEWDPPAPTHCEGCELEIGNGCELEGFAHKCTACGWTHGALARDSIKGTSIEGASFADGTPLSDSPGYFEAWAFFVEACEALAADTPFRCADLLAVNVFAREELTRDVEFLCAYVNPTYPIPRREWTTAKLAIPGRVKGSDELLNYLGDIGPHLFDGIECDESSPLIAVFNDPLED